MGIKLDLFMIISLLTVVLFVIVVAVMSHCKNELQKPQILKKMLRKTPA